MEGQANVRLLRLGHHRLQEAPRPLELLGPRVGAHALLGRQALRELVVVRRVAGARAARLFLVALDQPVRVEVVLDDRQPGLARRADGSDHVRGLRLGSRPPPDHVVEPRDHHVAEGQAAGLELVDARAEVGLAPGDLRPAREHVVDADLLQASHPGLVDRPPDAEADLRRVLAFGRHPRERFRLGVPERHGRREPRGPHRLQDVPAAQARAHVDVSSHQCVSEPSGRRKMFRRPGSVTSPIWVSRFMSAVTPRPGRWLVYALPFLKSSHSGR